jgi:hypothetical protein
MSLTELLTVLLIGTMVLGLVGMVMISMMKHDAKNLIRQSRVDGIRQTSIWLSDALSYAALPRSAGAGDTVFAVAEPQEMKFTAALPVTGDTEGKRVSSVRVVLGQTCWGSPGDDPGVLHRCVQSPKILADNSSVLCTKGAPDCPNNLFEDLVVASGVKDTDPIFTYFVKDGGVLKPGAPSVSASEIGNIEAVEMMITVIGPDSGKGSDKSIQATVFKRFTVEEWKKL